MMDFPLPSALRLLRWVAGGAFWTLLVLAVADALRTGHPAAAVAGVLLGLVHALGPEPFGLVHRLERVTIGLCLSGRQLGISVSGRSLPAPVWLVLITAGWVAPAVASPAFVWVAFPLCFAYLCLLPLWAATYGVSVLTSASIAAAAWHAGAVTAPVVAGPAAGTAAATVLALLHTAIHAGCADDLREHQNGFGR